MIKDLAKPDFRKLADATQGGGNRHIRLTMQPERTILVGALRIADLLGKPVAAKWGGASARRRVVTTESEHGIVSIMGASGLYYANTVGTFGAVSAGQNWGRLATAVHWRALKLVDAKECPTYYFLMTRFFLAVDEIFEEPFLVIISPELF